MLNNKKRYIPHMLVIDDVGLLLEYTPLPYVNDVDFEMLHTF